MGAASTDEVRILVELADRLEASPWRGRAGLVADAATALGVSMQTVYSRLKDAGLYDSGRKRRVDAGDSVVDESMALQVASMVQVGTRANGKRTMSIRQSSEISHANGVGPTCSETGEILRVSPTTLARAMRAHNCHPDQLAAGHTAIAMRSLHPNQTWQVDSSVGTLFYAPNGGVQGITWLDETEIYKNKPDAIARVSKDLCIRWAITDHCTDAGFVRYQAGSENSLGFIEFFLEAIQCRAGEPFHGVPLILVMDPGAVARAKAAQNLLKRLGVRVIVHRAKNARAKGGVEGFHNRWEMAFESRLAMWYPPDMEALNARADEVRRAWMSSARHRRHGMTRFEAWLRIREEQLRLAPSIELCRELVTGGEATRTTDNYGCISFAMAGFGSNSYRVSHLGIGPREKVRLVVNPYRAPAIDVLLAGEDGEDVAHTVLPVATDDFGFDAGGNVWGEAIRALPMTAPERQMQKIHLAAYGVPTQAEADAARRARQNAFEGEINPFADVEQVVVPTYMPRRGVEHPVSARARELPPVDLVDAVRRLRAAGDASPDLYARLQAEFQDGWVPDEAVAEREADLAARKLDRRVSA